MNIFKRVAFFASFVLLASPLLVSAHSTVSPSESGTSKYENFSLGVPVEKAMPTIAVRLLIPDGLTRVTPFVKPGWTISVTKTGEGETERVTEIRWTGGSIPVGQKDVFLFTARTPDKDASLAWKAYQTYSDGTVVPWDRDPKSAPGPDGKVANPYSVTEVSASYTGSSSGAMEHDDHGGETNWPLWLSGLAVFLSLAALATASRRH